MVYGVSALAALFLIGAVLLYRSARRSFAGALLPVGEKMVAASIGLGMASVFLAGVAVGTTL